MSELHVFCHFPLPSVPTGFLQLRDEHFCGTTLTALTANKALSSLPCEAEAGGRGPTELGAIEAAPPELQDQGALPVPLRGAAGGAEIPQLQAYSLLPEPPWPNMVQNFLDFREALCTYCALQAGTVTATRHRWGHFWVDSEWPGDQSSACPVCPHPREPARFASSMSPAKAAFQAALGCTGSGDTQVDTGPCSLLQPLQFSC